MATKHKKEDQILYIGCNQYKSLITIGTERGFRVFDTDSMKEVGGRGGRLWMS